MYPLEGDRPRTIMWDAREYGALAVLFEQPAKINGDVSIKYVQGFQVSLPDARIHPATHKIVVGDRLLLNMVYPDIYLFNVSLSRGLG